MPGPTTATTQPSIGELIQFLELVNWSYIIETIANPQDFSSWLFPEPDGRGLNLIPPPIWERLGEDRGDGYILGFMYIGLFGNDIQAISSDPYFSGSIDSVRFAEGHYDNSFKSRYITAADLKLSRSLTAQDIINSIKSNYSTETKTFNSSSFLSALGIGADVTPPVLIGSTPSGTDQPIPINANISLSFSEDIKPGKANIFIRNKKNGADNRVLNVNDSKQVVFSKNTLTIKPSKPLLPGSLYDVIISPNRILDIAGNSFSSINALQSALQFKTIGPINRKPIVRALAPLSGKAGNRSITKILSANGDFKAPLNPLLDELFVVSDADQDRITAFKIRISEPSDLQKSGFIVDKDGVAHRNHTFTQLSRSEISKMRYVGGEPGSSNKIQIQAFDGEDWSEWSPVATLRRNQSPSTSILDHVFSPNQFGKAQRVDNLLGINSSDPDGDKITSYTIVDWEASSNSGYFLLDGKRLDALTTISLSPSGLSKLRWIPGAPGITDPVSVTATDSAGDDSLLAYASWSTEPKTAYEFRSASGVNHITEGNTFEIKISKTTNLSKRTSLQYLVSGSSGPITAGIDDFSDVTPGKWTSINFDPITGTSASIHIKTKADNLLEGSETARVWIYDGSMDNNDSDWLKNPAYRPIDFQIHDTITYVMGPSSILAEGEISTMSVARFGGGNKKSIVRLQAAPLSKAYQGLTRPNGLASSKDFSPSLTTHTFTQDYDRSSRDGLLTASTTLIKDSVKESGGEMLVWRLLDSRNRPIDGALRTVTITDESRPSYTLQGLGFFQSIFSGLTSWIKGILPQAQSTTIGEQLSASLKKSSPTILPGTRILATPTSSGLIGVDAGTLIGVDAGTLIGVDAGTLIGVDGGTFISNKAGASLSQVTMMNGTPLIAAGGLN